jgi:hypothetical protein
MGQLAYVNDARSALWGPRLSLTPFFAKTDVAVLGIDDFFPYFVVTLEAGAHGTLRLEARLR